MIIGKGSNLLVSDKGIEGAVISLSGIDFTSVPTVRKLYAVQEQRCLKSAARHLIILFRGLSLLTVYPVPWAARFI